MVQLLVSVVFRSPMIFLVVGVGSAAASRGGRLAADSDVRSV